MNTAQRSQIVSQIVNLVQQEQELERSLNEIKEMRNLLKEMIKEYFNLDKSCYSIETIKAARSLCKLINLSYNNIGVISEIQF